MIRLFVAIDFPQRLKKQLADLVVSLKKEGYPLALEKEENFHLTLKFLGWCQEKKLGEIEQAIKKVSQEISPFWFKPTTIGYFLKESLILWVGVEAHEELLKLVKHLEKEMAKIGFKKEKREFLPHLTLGRRRRAIPAAKWRKIAEEIREKYQSAFSGFKVEEIVLMRSTLTPHGSIYSLLNTFSLKS